MVRRSRRVDPDGQQNPAAEKDPERRDRRTAETKGRQGGDRGSLNGTYVNKDLVDSTLLRHGDEVQIGKFRLIYFASPQGGG